MVGNESSRSRTLVKEEDVAPCREAVGSRLPLHRNVPKEAGRKGGRTMVAALKGVSIINQPCVEDSYSHFHLKGV